MAKNPKDVVVVAGVRTPMGRFGGTLKDIPAYDLGATADKSDLEKNRNLPGYDR